ncbi:signal recognition particle-docking protein FtsY [Lysobacter sp. GCM10012299]|uniref:signal recognition particle-docking protein FtsY n=1 Tax=Lysobacter sp. GCM10012299 TaxID=3317333 RepID=UPI0036087546
MLSFFRRKKPQTPAEAAKPGASEGAYSIEELAAAFPAPQEHEAPEVVVEAEAPPAAELREPVEAEPVPVPAEIIAAALDVEPVASQPPAPASVPATESVLPPEAALATHPVIPAAAPGKTGWRERLRGSSFARSFSGLFSRNPKLDDDLLDEIETALITADVGVGATTQLIESLRKRMKGREFADAQALLAALRADLLAMLRPVAQPLQIDTSAKPFVLLTVGVNGVGKTTTIGKLAKRFKDENRPLMLAAGDTFRAAAVAQLQAWGDRNGVPVVAQGQNADAASVAYDALQAAQARGTQVLIADTAGRLHTQQGLMAELGKIKRVIQKLDANAPHEVLMVIDGTTGQNALSQLRQFHAAVGVTGLVVTKLDGTAKGGVVFALAREFGIPIRFAGIGERPEDLRVFDAEAFVDALLPESLGA